jgi:general nucleoside transport system permease protein
MNPRMRDGLQTAGLYVLSVSTALALCAVLVSATGGSWRSVFTALLDGGVRSPGAWGLTLTTAAPLLVVAVGTILATKAGLVNIGQEGQLLIGASFCAYAAVRLGGPAPLVIVLSLLFAVVGGALWSGIAGVLRFWRNVPEVISTLLLVFVAFQVVNFGLTKEWLLLDRADRVNKLNTGEPLGPDVRLPSFRLFGNEVSVSVVVAAVLALGLAFVLVRTVWGFRLRMLGMNPKTARRTGVSPTIAGGTALVVSGGLAGAAGGLMLTSGVAGDRITSGFSGNIGWQGLLVALLARDRPMLAIPMAVVFAALRTGAGFLAATGVERRIADVVQSMLVLALLLPPALLFLRDRRRDKLAAARSAAATPAAAPAEVSA